ncbi:MULTISPECIES: isochorismatase family cysteine hydrolase [unclassified Salinivibrio]|uniref:isochorismatase family cysteine hydrolase n=1 Tax=unclassified Salinivibrio TaxID=2636825 RepID=UPI0009874E3D|nr:MULTISPECIES: isochorismatase family cysteine hydrolase [unclassified Salinivibrio]OOF14559.1 isochorismatase [Salinivibrio sp. PR919]OOF15559.1 isochorismatase [Salinivibrio sp. PR932]
MNEIKTLRDIAGASNCKVNWESVAVIFIDYQNEYIHGALPLGKSGEKALFNAQKILDKARRLSVPVFHVLHKGSSSSPIFNCDSELSDVVSCLTPISSEKVIHKMLPSSFYNTELESALIRTGCTQILVAGFMSHMCVMATTIGALERGYEVIVCEDACASRSLPDHQGSTIDERSVHTVSMAALGDRYASIQSTRSIITS